MHISITSEGEIRLEAASEAALEAEVSRLDLSRAPEVVARQLAGIAPAGRWCHAAVRAEGQDRETVAVRLAAAWRTVDPIMRATAPARAWIEAARRLGRWTPSRWAATVTVEADAHVEVHVRIAHRAPERGGEIIGSGPGASGPRPAAGEAAWRSTWRLP